MDIAIDVISWILLVSGSFFAIVGGLGIVRMPEFYSRLHGGGVTDTLGAALIIFGLMFQTGLTLATLFFLMVTSPASCHALAKSALSQGVKPMLDSKSSKTKSSSEGSSS